MTKIFNPSTFIINIASKPKIHKPKTTKISRRCYAIVALINGEYKAIVNNSENDSDKLILPFTEKSLSLKGKEYVFSKAKDKHGRRVCVIRNYIDANLNPGTDTQYDAVIENLLLIGHIIREDGKMYFNYEELAAYHYKAECHLSETKIDNSKPLFSK